MRQYQVVITMTTADEDWTAESINNEVVSWLDDLDFDIHAIRVTDMGESEEV